MKKRKILVSRKENLNQIGSGAETAGMKFGQRHYIALLNVANVAELWIESRVSDMSIYLSKRAYKTMTFEIDCSGINETGGVLLGRIDRQGIRIFEAVDGGYNSIASSTDFEYDEKYVSHVATRLSCLYEPELVVVGVWHKHNHFHRYPFSDADMLLHHEVMRNLGAESVSILFEKNGNGYYEMNIYIVQPTGEYALIDFEMK